MQVLHSLLSSSSSHSSKPLQQIIFENVTKKNLSSLINNLINKSSGEINNMHDEYGNNLLHIAVLAEDSNIIKYLIDKRVDKHKKNLHKLSPWDLAIRSQNQSIIQILIDNHSAIIDELKKELKLVRDTAGEYKLLNGKLQESVGEYKSLNGKLQESNNGLTSSLNSLYQNEYALKQEVTILKGQNKRLRQENDTVIGENSKLDEDNKKLKISVSSLIQSKKK